MQTIIIGAGASVPFFRPSLSTSFLTNKVSSRDIWVHMIQKYRSSETDNEIAEPDEVMSVINCIRKYSDANFEEIAEIIDKLSSIGFDNNVSDDLLNLLIRVYSDLTGGNISGNRFGPEWRDVPFLLREIIAESILELENNYKDPSYNNLSALQKAFFNTICEKSNDVSVLSFNYDDCVYDSLDGLGFETGFTKCQPNGSRLFDTSVFMSAKKVAYFPHGHVKFHFTDTLDVVFWPDSNKADEERWKGIDYPGRGATTTVLYSKFAYNFNTFLTTGQTKDDALNQLPYSFYYHRLASDIGNSSCIYIIGYSFGDEHINRLLRSYLYINPSNKVLVIDKYDPQITLTNEYFDSNSIISKIHTFFETLWRMKVDARGQKIPFNSAACESLNKKGYGELFSQVYFYKKGYNAFLNEYERVLEELRF